MKSIAGGKLKFKGIGFSNIALIKYMGKTSHDKNLPSNSSISLTLPHLHTEVELESTTGVDRWEPFRDNRKLELNEKGVKRFTDHLKRMKDRYSVSQSFIVRSANNFPKDSGMASSASSFAALTLAFGEYLKDQGREILSQELAQLSREASGSSCRSFFGPFCIWEKSEGRVVAAEIPFKNLKHVALVVSSKAKEVSSSEAHKRVSTSPLFEGRFQRTEVRMKNLMDAFSKQDWREAYEITKSEFWDMMGLFHTSHPSFSYLEPGSIEILNWVDQIWKDLGDGPIVTMDAGPNVHLIFREDQSEIIKKTELELQHFPQVSNFGSEK
ncbi:MAG: diphosphomevalonate decarboxylase [Bdellovibrionales bacterium]|nr:diphosphomevalonate decarboxylase [Bdellovibrionales bacterium]